MSNETIDVVIDILDEVAEERENQIEQWGHQHHPSIYSESFRRQYVEQADRYKQMNDARASDGTVTWDGILLEEAYEATSEPDLYLRRIELVQVAAVAVAEIESIDRLLASDESPYAEEKVTSSNFDYTKFDGSAA